MRGTIAAWFLLSVHLARPAVSQTRQVAQTEGRVVSPRADSVVVVADSTFRTGGLGQWLLGRTYRDLWGTPVKVAVLDLDSFAGGLTPVEQGGGLQTKSLRFQGKNGKEYQFRLVRKDPEQVVGEELYGTFVGDLVRDQMSAIHPGGSLVTPTLMKAVGILHAPPMLRYLPDHPRLGEFRKEFADQLGTIEERPDEAEQGRRGFAGATRVEDTDDMLEAMREQPTARVNSRAYLKGRMIDFLIGDWDRHEDQYRWALVGSGDRQRWEPIPRDRDQAFVRYDGALLTLARTAVPKLVVFDETFPSAEAATYNGRHLDRRILNDLEWPVWDSLTRVIQSALSDEVIDGAVSQLPPEYRRRNGAMLRRVLRTRRERLPDAVADFYQYVSRQVMIDAGHVDDQVLVKREPDGNTLIEVRRAGRQQPYYQRTFKPGETREVRLFLHDGADRVRIEGTGPGPKVRLIGGKGQDSVMTLARPDRVEVFDTDAIDAPGLGVDAKPYVAPHEADEDIPIQQDWGGAVIPAPQVHINSYAGLVLGMGVQRIGYGFRRHPYASRHTASLEYSFEREAARAEITTRWRLVNRQLYYGAELMASGIEGGRFFGFGDTTTIATPKDQFLTHREAYEIAPYLGYGLETRTRLWLMLKARHTITDMSDPTNATGSLNDFRPPGLGDVGQLGPAVRFVHDSRDTRGWTTRGVYLQLEGDYFPITWANGEGPSGSVQASISTYLSPPQAPERLTLALRAGGRRVWGEFPYFESAFLGGNRSLRGYSTNRFSGDASLYGNAELRVKLLDSRVILPTEIGVLGLADAGRVWFDGQAASWRSDFGGGIWISALERTQGAGFGIAKGDDGARAWFYLGKTF